ncbi:hypothetical protein HMPREF1556_01450 [Porphyromonas sp. oral taxon 278 str. W7784]|nr:hypothetical protein HMPREF1556_01450 [Porphyromonas sp. oral taxon 278 str. W7784]
MGDLFPAFSCLLPACQASCLWTAIPRSRGNLFRWTSLQEKGNFLACNGREVCGRLDEVFQVISLDFVEEQAQK